MVAVNVPASYLLSRVFVGFIYSVLPPIGYGATDTVTFDKPRFYLMLMASMLCIGIALNLRNKRKKLFLQVEQGMILGKVTAGGGLTPLRWMIVVEGRNKFNQIRQYHRKVDAGNWHDKHVAGDYVDFRNT